MLNSALKPFALVALIALLPTAHAATLTYTFTADLYGNHTGGSYAPSFDSSLGRLTKVTTASTILSSVSQTVSNQGPTTSFTLLTGAGGNFELAYQRLYGTVYNPVAAVYLGDHVTDNVSLGTGQSFTSSYVGTIEPDEYDTFGYVQHASGEYTDPALLALFETGETFHVDNYVAADAFLNPGGGFGLNYSYHQSGNATITSTLTYEYTPVPEPASLAVLGFGGLALIRRRR